MTIKEFARLCGCNPQTLRYYDHVDLLKPARVDQWSGYRYYDEEQALVFVKIRNLQKAGFTIDEIKGLLDKDDTAVYNAFSEKIREAEERLQTIKNIQRSYQTEMKTIQEKIKEVREKVMQSMKEYDPSEEFGIGSEQYAAIIDNVNLAFESMGELDIKDIGYEEFSDGDAPEEETQYLDILNDPNFTVVYERHGWEHVKDFFEDVSDLEDGADYALVFEVVRSKGTYNTAFGNTILGMLLARNPEKKTSLSCSMGDSKDGRNHFWFLKRR